MGMGPAERADLLRQDMERIILDYSGPAKYQQTIRGAATKAIEAIDGYETHREAELVVIRDEFRTEVDRARQRAEEAEDRLKARMSLEAKELDKKVELSDTRSKIMFTTPAGSAGYHRDWTVKDLESILYDLRMSGAEDDAQLSFNSNNITAKVPFPEAVTGKTYGAYQPRETVKAPMIATETEAASASVRSLKKGLSDFQKATLAYTACFVVVFFLIAGVKYLFL